MTRLVAGTHVLDPAQSCYEAAVVGQMLDDEVDAGPQYVVLRWWTWRTCPQRVVWSSTDN